MVEIEKPKIELKELSNDGKYAKFVCEPLECGYGTTIGNSLRRILLSSLTGAAVTSIKIDGILHEFSSIPGMHEDVTNIVLNLKSLYLRMHTNEPKVIRIDVDGDAAAGEREITAADIEPDADVEILNPDLHIATINADGQLHMEMTVEQGRGYVSADKNKKLNQPIGVIPIDSIFSPILRVNYAVEDTRIGNVTDYDKLTLEVWTNGSISPEEAVSEAAKILISQLKLFQTMTNLAVQEEQEEITPEVVVEEPKPEEQEDENSQVLNMSVDELDLSVRALNCLKRDNVYMVRDLITKTEEDMIHVRNLGKKSLDDIKKKLKELGLSLRPNEE